MIRTFAIALATLTALPGLACAQNSIAVGQTVRARLESRDPVLEDGSHYRCYRLVTRAGQRYRAEMRSAAFDAYLGVGSDCLTMRQTNDDGAGGTDARIDFTGNGEAWWIRANSLSEGDTGAFTLTVVDQGPAPRLRVSAIEVGQSVQGSLSQSDAVADDGSYFDCYVFSARAGQAVAIEMRSDAFDAYLSLFEGGACSGEGFDTDDDGGGGTDARLEATLPAGGSWSFRANSLSPGQVGAYTLALSDNLTAQVQAIGPFMAFFDASSDILTPQARAILDNAASQIGTGTDVQIIVSGHADRKEAGSNAAVGLSQRRANNVREYLVRRGVPAGIITTEAYGNSRPLVESSGAEPQNRRIEITVGPGSGW